MLIALLLVTGTFSSCKKEAAAPKDYSLSIKDKTWWGMLTNAGETAQAYSVRFNAENTLVWSQLSGDYPGRWSVEKNKLTLTFTSPNVTVTADITDDNNLANITTNTANKVNSGELVADPNISLDNTVWTGSVNNPLQTMQLNFLPNLKVQRKIGIVTYNPIAYTRSPSGGFIRIDLGSGIAPYIIGVIASRSEMNGIAFIPATSWQLIKQ